MNSKRERSVLLERPFGGDVPVKMDMRDWMMVATIARNGHLLLNECPLATSCQTQAEPSAYCTYTHHFGNTKRGTTRYTVRKTGWLHTDKVAGSAERQVVRRLRAHIMGAPAQRVSVGTKNVRNDGRWEYSRTT